MKATKNPPSKRLTFTNGFADDFCTPVPEYFGEAIRKQELSKGDTFFGSRQPYEQDSWAEAIKGTAWAIQIKESMTGGKTVLFERFRQDEAKKKLFANGTFKLHWEDFVARLRSGDFEQLGPDLGI